MSSPAGPRPAPDAISPGALLDAVPGAVLVVEGLGTIRWCTESAAAMVGTTASQLVGRSVLELVSADTAWAYAASVALATDYPDVVMGPMRVSFLAADGEPRVADLWASNRLDDPAIAGIVCLVTEQTAASGLADAVSAVAEGASSTDVVALVERALAGHPVVADAELVHIDDADLHPALVDVVGRSAGSGVRSLFGDLDELAAVGLDGLARERSAGALWVEPVPAPGAAVPAALVLWRRRPGNPSPNQLRSIFQAAAIVRLLAAGPGAPEESV